MKRILALIISILLLFSLTGCQLPDEDSGETPPETEQTPTGGEATVPDEP